MHKLIKIEMFLMLQKIPMSNKRCSSKLLIIKESLETNVSQFPQIYKQHSCIQHW